jgi:hypothetical protein
MDSKDVEMTSAFQCQQHESSQKCIIAESRIMFKAQPKVQRFTANQPNVIILAPILPGKAEAWRRMMQEILGVRRREYETSRQRLGIRAEWAWINETRQQTIGVIMIEADHLEQAVVALAASEHPFDRWFREQLQHLQGLHLNRLNLIGLPDLVLAWHVETEDAS